MQKKMQDISIKTQDKNKKQSVSDIYNGVFYKKQEDIAVTNG